MAFVVRFRWPRPDVATESKRGTPPPPPGVTLKTGESPIHLATALEVAGVQNPELLLARERVTEAMADKQLAAALEADEAYHGQIVG